MEGGASSAATRDTAPTSDKHGHRDAHGSQLLGGRRVNGEGVDDVFEKEGDLDVDEFAADEQADGQDDPAFERCRVGARWPHVVCESAQDFRHPSLFASFLQGVRHGRRFGGGFTAVDAGGRRSRGRRVGRAPAEVGVHGEVDGGWAAPLKKDEQRGWNVRMAEWQIQIQIQRQRQRQNDRDRDRMTK